VRRKRRICPFSPSTPLSSFPPPFDQQRKKLSIIASILPFPFSFFLFSPPPNKVNETASFSFLFRCRRSEKKYGARLSPFHCRTPPKKATRALILFFLTLFPPFSPVRGAELEGEESSSPPCPPLAVRGRDHLELPQKRSIGRLLFSFFSLFPWG